MMPRSTAHDALAPTAQAARWWVDGPIFSTDRRGERITSLAPGARPGALGTDTVLRAIAVFAFWTVFGFFALSRVAVPFPVPWVEEMSQQWWWYVIVGVGALMLAVLGTFGLYSTVLARFGQHRVEPQELLDTREGPILEQWGQQQIHSCKPSLIRVLQKSHNLPAPPENSWLGRVDAKTTPFETS
ncbi:hypothetical protein [Microbacterium paludicola]|uniref:hypothetical protein n=1 Tax=Microbacterium paludicola TaxID=300019 RepID=UPI00119D2897|nr:hypothetical protein [Microbacterium paludicola]